MSVSEVVPERVADSHVWLFPGANGGRWVELVRKAYEDPSDDGQGEEEQEEEYQEGQSGARAVAEDETSALLESASRPRLRSPASELDDDSAGHHHQREKKAKLE